MASSIQVLREILPVLRFRSASTSFTSDSGTRRLNTRSCSSFSSCEAAEEPPRFITASMSWGRLNTDFSAISPPHFHTKIALFSLLFGTKKVLIQRHDLTSCFLIGLVELRDRESQGYGLAEGLSIYNGDPRTLDARHRSKNLPRVFIV